MSDPNLNDPCEQLRDLLPAYTIGATDPDETRLVESLLSQCPEAVTELEDYAAMSTAMLFTAPPAAPSADLGARILAAATAPAAAPRPARGKARRRVNGALVGLVALAALLVITNAYWLLQMETMRRQQDDLLVLLRGREEALVALSAPDVQTIAMVSTASERAVGAVLWSPGRETAVLRADALPPLERDRAYQLWLIDGESRLSAGVFEVDPEGQGVLVFRSDRPLTAFAALGISNEPEGGSPAPTTSPVAISQRS